MSKTDDRYSRASMTPDGHGIHTRLTPVSWTGTHNILVDLRPVIPIVFLPGVMGSNLFNEKCGFTPEMKVVLQGRAV